MTFQEKFDELKKTYLDNTLFAGADGDFAAEITLTDPDCGGTFYLKKTGGMIDMEPYDYKDSTVKLTLTSELLEDILNNRMSAVAAFMDGRLDAEGDVNHALSLVNALKKQKPKKRRSDTKKA
jgi:putative sterol carrier protein